VATAFSQGLDTQDDRNKPRNLSGCARGLLAHAPAIEDALILNADPSNAEVLHQTLDAKLLNF